MVQGRAGDANHARRKITPAGRMRWPDKFKRTSGLTNGMAGHCSRYCNADSYGARGAPALWRRGEVQLDRLAAGTRARLDGELSGAGLEDQRRDLFGAVDADPGAEQPAARAVAIRLVRCQSEALAHHASPLASGAAAADFMMRSTTTPSTST